MARYSYGKRRSGGRWLSAIVLLLLLAGLVFLFRQPLAGLAFVLTGGSMGMTKAVDKRPLGYFYRFTARYSHKGEPLVFDYVVACNIRVTRYRGGDRSDDSTYTPKVMMLPTKTGGAVMVRTIRACNGQTTENGRVPEDLFPRAIWFDNVEDMTFGWGYASEDAYDSALSQLEFHGARISRADHDEWQAWREASARDFKPTGMITTPWGMTFNEPWYGRSYKEPHDPTQKNVPHSCLGYFRMLVPEDIRAGIRKYRPNDAGRFWSPSPTLSLEIDTLFRSGRYADGSRMLDYDWGNFYSGTKGISRRDGGGTIPVLSKKYKSPEIYPLLPRSKSWNEEITAPLDYYPRRIRFENGAMNGFLACGGDKPADKTIQHFDLDFRNKKHPIYIDDNRVLPDFNPLGLPRYIFDRDEYVFMTTFS